jgi:hypothetical protein
MTGKRKQRRCRICRNRPPWRYKNCPPGICKHCYHQHIWTQRPARRDRAASTDSPLPASADHGHVEDDMVINDLRDWFEWNSLPSRADPHGTTRRT